MKIPLDSDTKDVIRDVATVTLMACTGFAVAATGILLGYALDALFTWAGAGRLLAFVLSVLVLLFGAGGIAAGVMVALTDTE